MLNLNCASGYNYKCSGNKIDMEYYANTDCSDSVSAECSFENLEVMPTGCHFPFTLGECKTLLSFTLMGQTFATSTKFTGSCPDDDPCDSCCPTGTCDGPDDASKPACEACNACNQGTPCPADWTDDSAAGGLSCPTGCVATRRSRARRLLFSSLPLECGPGCEPM